MLRLLAVTLIVSCAAAVASGGRLQRLKDLRLRWSPMLFAALVVGLSPLFIELSTGWRQATQVIANLGVVAFLVMNVRAVRGAVRMGLLIVALGWSLNAIVIAANGAMPLSLWAYERAGLSGEIDAGRGGFFKIEPAGPETVLRPLGDVIPVPPMNQVVSIGDIVLMIGVGTVIVGAAHGARERRTEREATHA